jgi:putative phosphoesterase
MKLALMGDIHGNQLALQVVLEAASAAKVDRLLVTGDLVGYYFEPLHVLELLSSWTCDVVRGNHEEMLSKARNDESYLVTLESRYGSGVRVALQQLSSTQLDRLCSLPHPLELDIDGSRILLTHGAPWNLDQYIYPDADQEMLARYLPKNYDLVVMGHTHYPMLRHVGSTVVVNPGSVGQPRDRKPGACWALFNTKDHSVELRRESYDSSRLVRECQLNHPELPYLADVLERTN